MQTFIKYGIVLLTCYATAGFAFTPPEEPVHPIPIKTAKSVAQQPEPQEIRCQPVSCEELVKQAEEHGPIRLFIGLKIPKLQELPQVVWGMPMTEVSAIEAQQKAAAAEVRERVLNRMKPYKVEVIYVFMITFVAKVDAAAISALLKDPDVKGLTMDLPVLKPTLEQSSPIVGAPQAWADGYAGAGRAIVILDTGVDKYHPFLAGKVIDEYCFSTTDTGFDPQYGAWKATSLCPSDPDSSPGQPCVAPNPNKPDQCAHGTHVAGIAAGRRDDEFSGVAKDADIIAIQVFSKVEGAGCGPNPGDSPCIQALHGDIINALTLVLEQLSAEHPIAAINASLGAGYYQTFCDGMGDTFEDYLNRIYALKNNRGIATIISTGNDGYVNGINVPACISAAVSVGATDKYDQVAYYSNSTDFVSLLAPGGAGRDMPDIYNIRSAIPNGEYAYLPGTSMAAPHVAGGFAVLREQSPTATVDQLIGDMRNYGKPILDNRNQLTIPRMSINDGSEYGLPTTLTSYAGTHAYYDNRQYLFQDVAGYVYAIQAENSIGTPTLWRLSKSTPTGQLVWETDYQVSLLTPVYVYAAALDPQGNISLATQETASLTSYLVKYNTSGQRVYKQPTQSFQYAVAADGFSNTYLTAYDLPSGKPYLSKYNAAGGLAWKVELPGQSPFSFGFFEVLTYDSGGYLYVTGYTNEPDTAHVSKYDAVTGELLWTTKLAAGNISPASMQIDPLGAVYVLFTTGETNNNWEVVRVNLHTGEQEWTADAAGFISKNNRPKVRLDPSGHVYVGWTICGADCSVNSYYAVDKYTHDRKMEWRQVYQLDKALTADLSGLQVDDRNVYMTGLWNAQEIRTIKADSETGNQQWYGITVEDWASPINPMLVRNQDIYVLSQRKESSNQGFYHVLKNYLSD